MSDRNLVYTVHYCVQYDNANDTASSYVVARGTVGLSAPDTGKYVPYERLTEDLILQWVHDALGGEEEVGKMEQSFLQNISPLNPVLHTPLTW